MIGESAGGYSVASSYQQHLTPQQGDFGIFDELSGESTEDYLMIDENLEVNVENTLVLNQAYKEILLALRDKLNTLQFANKARQQELAREIEIIAAEQQTTKKTEKQRKKNIPFAYFGMPYFKDLGYRSPPLNADADQIQSITNGLYNVSMFHFNKPCELDLSLQQYCCYVYFC